MRLVKKKLLALGMSAVMIMSTLAVQATDSSVTDLDVKNRVGDEGCLEIPGTVSTFDEYNTSFLSVSGFAKGKVNDRTADYGTSKHRKVTTSDELFQAIRDAKLNTGTDTEVSEGAVTIIEIMNDLKITYNANYVDVIQNNTLNAGYENVQGDLVDGVVDIRLDDIKGLTIFSQNGAKILGGTLCVGTGGSNSKGCEDIVIRNLVFDGAWQWDNQGRGKDSGWTYITIYHSFGVWIDHCSFSVASDGNINLESGSNGVTISWCKIGLTSEEVKQGGNIIHSSITEMEKNFEVACNQATNRGGVTDVVALKDSYYEVVDKINMAGYDINSTTSLNRLQSNDADLYAEYQSVKPYYTYFYLNKGTMYADMRLSGITPEEIMEYAAYQSRVHLVGSGDREFKDYDILKTNTVTESAVGVEDSTNVAINEVVDGDTTTTTETFVKDEVATVTTTSLRIITDSNDRLQLSLGYNRYCNVGQRVPMIRMGVGHMYNCYIDDMAHYDILKENVALSQYGGYRLSRGINARDGASIGADTCVFYGINQPIIGEEKQGNDITNMNAPWDSLYADALNHAVIVNSKLTNSDGETYTGSSWDNNGDNLFTMSSSNMEYTDQTLKKWSWNSSIVSISDTPISEVSKNDMCNGKVWPTLPYIVPIYEEDGVTPVLNMLGNQVYEPFVWEYDYDAVLPYEYQLVELDDVEPVVTSQSGAGVIRFNNGENWIRTEYEKGEDIICVESEKEPEVSGEPIETVAPTVTDTPVDSELPIVTSTPVESEQPGVTYPPISEEPSVSNKEVTEEAITNEDGTITNKVTEKETREDGTILEKVTEITTTTNGSVIEKVEEKVTDSEGNIWLKILKELLKIAKDVYEQVTTVEQEYEDGSKVIKDIEETSKVDKHGKVVKETKVKDERKDKHGICQERFEYTTEELPEDIQWNVDKVHKDKVDEKHQKAIERRCDGEYQTYDISPEHNGEKVDVSKGSVKVTLHGGDKWKGKDVRVYDPKEDKWLDAEVDGEYISFEAKHFSEYTVSAVVNYTLGNVDDTGNVELQDAQQALRIALSCEKNPTKKQKLAADVDENGVVELNDAKQILRKALLLIDEFEKAETK